MEITKEMIDDLRTLAKDLGCKVGNLRDADKLNDMIKLAREELEVTRPSTTTRAHKQQEVRKEAMKLVRVRITPMSPYYKQMPGAQFQAGNKFCKANRFVQFNEAWHVEEILLNMLKAKQYRAKKETKDPSTGRKVYTNVFHKAFGIEILPALSKDELYEMAADQKARGAIDQ